MYSVKTKRTKTFLDSVTKAIAEGATQKYYKPIIKGKSIITQMKKG